MDRRLMRELLTLAAIVAAIVLVPFCIDALT